MLRKQLVALTAVVLAAVLAWGCHDPSPSPSPSAPSPPTTRVAPTPPPPPTQVTPTHTLIITASPSCTTLPAVAQKRTYPVQLQEKPDGTLVALVVNSYDIMVGWANEPGFTGKRDGDAVRFSITDDIFGDFGMIERIGGVGDMGYSGAATGTIDKNGKIVAIFSGDYRLGYGGGPVLCSASDHHIDMVPAGG